MTLLWIFFKKGITLEDIQSTRFLGQTSTVSICMSKEYVKHINDQLSWRIKATFSFEVRDLWLHSCRGNCMTIGHAVAYFARAACAFNAGVKCQHCRDRWQQGGFYQRPMISAPCAIALLTLGNNRILT